MKWIKYILVAGLAVGLAAPAAPARQRKRAPRAAPAREAAAPGQSEIRRDGSSWIEEETGSLPAGSRLRVVSSQGAIEVRGGEQQQVTFRVRKRVTASSEEAARRALAATRVQARRSGEVVFLTFSAPSELGGDFYIVVPRNLLQAELDTMAGGIVAQDIAGELQVNTAGGNIEVDRVGGGVKLTTMGGPILMGSIGGAVRAETAGGQVRLTSAGADVVITAHGGDIDVGQVKGSVQAQTAGGEIHVQNAGGNVRVETAGGHISVGEGQRVTALTASGSIHVDKARAAVEARTASGTIELLNCFGPVRAESASGSIHARIAASRAAWAQSFLDTASGDIRVFIPRDLPLTIQAAILGARRNQGIQSDFPITVRGGQGRGPQGGVVGEGAVNGGGPQLQLRTLSGNIEIRSQK